MKEFICVCGKSILVDDEDFEKVIFFGSWYCNQARESGPMNHSKNGFINLSNFVLDYLGQVDHKNQNNHDARKHNLRPANKQQNSANRSLQSNSTTGFKGVNLFRNGKYRAHITVNQKTIHLGYFEDIFDAADSYNEAAKKYFGEFACLNQTPRTEEYAS